MEEIFLLVAFVALLAARVPIGFTLGLVSLGYIYFFLPDSASLSVIPQRMFASSNSFSLTAIPLFILVGEVMNKSGIAQRLVDIAQACVGHLRGGLGLVSLIASMFFASFSGSAVANAAGTGAITIPAMKRSGFDRGTASAIESASSSIGSVMPPSIIMVIYGSLAGVSIGGLFVGGYVPAVLSGIALIIIVRFLAQRQAVPVLPRTPVREILPMLTKALPALAVPVIIMGGILAGLMTATESGAIAATYTVLIALFAYRSLSIKDLPRILRDTAVTTGVVMLVVATAALFTWIMAFEKIPSRLAEALVAGLAEQWQVMLVIVLFLVVVGMFVEAISAVALVAPVFLPIAAAMGIDPLFMGVIICSALALGVCTPPVGVVLFVTSKIAGASIERTSARIVPLVAVLILVVCVIALLPGVVLFLPNLFFG